MIPHIAHCLYYATGEGVTVLVAIAPTRAKAEELYNRLPGADFWKPEFASSLDDVFGGPFRAANWMPEKVRLDLAAGRPCEFAMQYHLNMS